MDSTPEELQKKIDEMTKGINAKVGDLDNLMKNFASIIPGAVVKERKASILNGHIVTVTRSGSGTVIIDFGKDEEKEKAFYDSLK
jgi:hypothetical protein